MVEPASFGSVVAALFKPDEIPNAASLFYHTNNDPFGVLYPLDAIVEATALPPYWTLSAPIWWRPEMGAIDFSFRGEHSRKLRQQFAADLGHWPTEGEAFAVNHPFLVIEVDYLLVDKDDQKHLPPEECARRKRLQAHAMAQAFQQSGFPFAALVHSGSKSIHCYVRLDDTEAKIAQMRTEWMPHLMELCWTVFGHFDHTVFKESGRVRLVRTPGALREDGTPQQILAVGGKTTIDALFAWFHGQLDPEALDEMRRRQPVPLAESLQRTYALPASDLRRDTLRPHAKGERGTHWMHVAKKLAMAGCKKPVLRARPTAAAPYGQWDAAWLWWVAAIAFNDYAEGSWFFSQDPADWNNADRERWWTAGEMRGLIAEHRKARGLDTAMAPMVDKLWQAQQQQMNVAALPDVAQSPGAGQAPFPQAVQPPAAPEEKPKKEKGEGFSPELQAARFFLSTNTTPATLIKCGKLAGEQWWIFNGRAWERTSEDWLTKMIYDHIAAPVWPEKLRREVLRAIELECLQNTPWKENEHAIAFENGTFYFGDNLQSIDFKAGFDPADRLRSTVPCAYDPAAVCPEWLKCMERFLPDAQYRALFQEMFGYTFVPQQRFQSFFLLVGSGSNFKSTAMRVLEHIHGHRRESVVLSKLGDEFALGTLPEKRLAIDAEAESTKQRDGGDLAGAMSVLKSWVGGDEVKVAKKNVQGWSTALSAKLILLANRRPRFMDPTKGVWRRLKLIPFTVSIPADEVITDYDKILIKNEMSGIVCWALQGLMRALAQGKLTVPPQHAADLIEYQENVDNVLQFQADYLEEDPTTPWRDLRPIYKMYSEYAKETGSGQTRFGEFMERLKMSQRFEIARPHITEKVVDIPQGMAMPSARHYWAIKNCRCIHALGTIAVQTSYTPAFQPPTPVSPMAAVAMAPLQFPGAMR